LILREEKLEGGEGGDSKANKITSRARCDPSTSLWKYVTKLEEGKRVGTTKFYATLDVLLPENASLILHFHGLSYLLNTT
jgi:hypothetical protein